MIEKYIVIIPSGLERLNQGFFVYNSVKKIVYEANTISEVHRKFPNAINIRRL